MGIIVNINYCFELNNKIYKKFGQYIGEVETNEDRIVLTETELKRQALYNEFEKEIDNDTISIFDLLDEAKFEFVEVC